MAHLDVMSADYLSPGTLRKKRRYATPDGSVELGTTASGSLSLESYQKIQQAKSANSIVLQVEGDSEPIRVLPLPDQSATLGGAPKSAFVSELLTQTGLLKRFGAVDVTVFRPSADTISGIRMDVQIDEEGQVEPVTDYALHAGDRVYVRKRRKSLVQGMLDSIYMR